MKVCCFDSLMWNVTNKHHCCFLVTEKNSWLVDKLAHLFARVS